MKITAFDGSPRKNGNSSMLLTAFLSGAEQNNADVEIFKTDQLELKSCRGCLMCNSLKRCSIRGDGWSELSEKILKSDVLVFSSPIYFHHTTASMKKLIDRFRSFIHVQITEDSLIHTPHEYWNKRIFLLTAHGSSAAEDAGPLIDLFKFMTDAMGSDNEFQTLNALRLAVPGQISYDAEKLKDLYRRLKLPVNLVDEDVSLNRKYLSDAKEMGYNITKK